MTEIISFNFVELSTKSSALLISLTINVKILTFFLLVKVWYAIALIIAMLTSFFFSLMSESWSRSTWVLCFRMKADSINWFIDFIFVDRFKMIIDINFRFFRFILQILLSSSLWNADWLLAFELTSFDFRMFNADVNQSFAELIKIWFLFNQRLSKIILCWFRRVINRDIISFLCSCIVTEIYRACVIDLRSRVLLYEWIDFDLNSEIDWISKHSHSFKINESFMNVMSVTLMFIRAKNRNIFSRLFRMTFTINDLKSNESSSILMKQDMSMSFSITTLTKANRFSNSLQFHAFELI